MTPDHLKDAIANYVPEEESDDGLVYDYDNGDYDGYDDGWTEEGVGKPFASKCTALKDCISSCKAAAKAADESKTRYACMKECPKSLCDKKEAVGEATCACKGGNQKGTKNGDKVCQWRGGNCSAFFEGCDKKGATVCEMQKADTEKAVGACDGTEFNMWGTGMCNVGTDCSSYIYQFCEKTCCSKRAEMAVADDCYWTGDCEEALADDCYWTGDCEGSLAAKVSGPVGPSKVVQAFALVGLLAMLWGAGCHFFKN